jgi:hypothetical protein
MLIMRMLPLYLMVLLSYWAGGRLKLCSRSMASFSIYVLSPLVTFSALCRIDPKPSLLLLPLIVL